MQTYSLFLFISGKFWKFRLVHHYHFQLCSDHVYFCFCLLIFPHASPSETTVKMKPFLFIFRVEPGGPPAQRRTTFCLFPSVMSSIYRERPKKSVSRVSIESRCPRNVERRQQVRFLYRSFYVNMENLHFFFWSCCYLGVCPIDTLLCPSECMLYEWVTMNSLCIFTWRKKTAQGY